LVRKAREVEDVSQRTLSIIKPDGVRQGAAGKVIARLEEAGFKILGLRMIRMSKQQAEGFYAIHKERPFFSSLTDFMSSGPAIVLVLEKDNAIAELRKLMGATDLAKADEGTIRKDYATSVEANIIHGSDSPESAAAEIPFFFTTLQIQS
jgi:nucleoside-diphosphate kinase